jgi:hypothetical protein
MQNRLRTILLICVIAGSLSAQTKSNLEQLASLVDSSFSGLPVQVSTKTELKVNASGQLSVLSGYIQNSFVKYVRANTSVAAAPARQLTYTLEDARISYDEVFRDGLIGDLKLVRASMVRGNYIATGDLDTLHRFLLTRVDTVLLSQKGEMESPGYTFLSPGVPAGSSFSSIWEPAAIVATIGVAVYLLFTVRKTN